LNFIGYRIVYNYAQQHADIQLEAALDRNIYNESDLITIKVPLSLPYQTEQAEFQRVDGEINFNGKILKYVKRKISEGNLILLCLPDYNKMRLAKEKDDFYKESNSLAQNSNSKKQENSKGNSFKNLLSEYDQPYYSFVVTLLEEHVSNSFLNHQVALSAFPHSTPEQPPERA
jgi:hypothetical protein